jgi:hypothetical protein
MEKKRNKSFEGLLLGAVRISVEPGDLIDLLNILLELGERYRNIRKDDHSASVDLSYPAVTKVKRKCAERGIKADAELLYGIPYLWTQYYCLQRFDQQWCYITHCALHSTFTRRRFSILDYISIYA